MEEQGVNLPRSEFDSQGPQYVPDGGTHTVMMPATPCPSGSTPSVETLQTFTEHQEVSIVMSSSCIAGLYKTLLVLPKSQHQSQFPGKACAVTVHQYFVHAQQNQSKVQSCTYQTQSIHMSSCVRMHVQLHPATSSMTCHLMVAEQHQ